MPRSGDVIPLITREEKHRLAGLPPAAEAFVVAVRELWPGAEMADVRRSDDPTPYEDD